MNDAIVCRFDVTEYSVPILTTHDYHAEALDLLAKAITFGETLLDLRLRPTARRKHMRIDHAVF